MQCRFICDNKCKFSADKTYCWDNLATIFLYELLCLNFEIYNGANVKQYNYLYNDDNMFVINPLYTY